MRPVTERTVTWVKEDFVKCGLKLDKFSDLPNRIGELRGACVTVVKARGDSDFGVHIKSCAAVGQSDSTDHVPF